MMTSVYILSSENVWVFPAFVLACEVGLSSRNVVSRTFPNLSHSMLTPMKCWRMCDLYLDKGVEQHVDN